MSQGRRRMPFLSASSGNASRPALWWLVPSSGPVIALALPATTPSQRVVVWAPKFVGLGNFSTALSSYGFWRIVLNTLYFVVVYTTLNLIVSLALASALSPRAKAVRGKAFLRVVYFLPVVTPLVASSLVWSLMYNQGGIINAALGVVGIPAVPWLNSGAWAMPSIIFRLVFEK